ncbi:hypothetical protein NP493_1171g00057 [Ridgeia piscesae]|uniref:VWFC domain-containing protein n=1 Tax=Ridgeia piscesae TaxID=27915 RepID=A0AAD9KES8_RIDPI|nr:hypothetical protein NP493_1171g00057 [Ridgeia piscesae]
MASLITVASLFLLVASGFAATTKFCDFNGRLYKPLQVLPTRSACKYCVCSEETFEPVCFPIRCPAPACSNPVYKDGHCCAVCPGPKTACLVDGITIEEGESVTMPLSSRCYKICMCPSVGKPGVGIQADCAQVCRTS